MLSLIYGIGLPAGWQTMIRAFFDEYLGQPVESSIIPAALIPGLQLVWSRRAPPRILKTLEFCLKLSYEIACSEDNKESRELILPIIFLDGKWMLLLFGPWPRRWRPTGSYP